MSSLDIQRQLEIDERNQVVVGVLDQDVFHIPPCGGILSMGNTRGMKITCSA